VTLPVSIHNGRVKLRAGALNTRATSCFGVGALAPLASAFYNLIADHVPVHTIVIGIVFWFGAAIFLHRQAARTLEGLKE
jgi:predicted tellurium resistance membrane protein TerC